MPELVKKLNEARDVYADDAAVYWSSDHVIEYCPLPCTSSGAVWSAQGVVPANRKFAYVPAPNPQAPQAAGTFFFGAEEGAKTYMAKHTMHTSTPVNVGPAPLAIAADRYNAYFSSGSSIYSMYLAFTSSTKLLDVPVPAAGLALSANALFWHSSPIGGLYGCKRASCAAPTEIVSPQAARNVAALFATATDVYFADNYGVTQPLGGADILSCPANVALCKPTLIASREKAVNAIAVSGGYIYWSNGDSTVTATGWIRGCKLGACTPTTLASSLPQPVAISAYGSNDVYVAAYGLEGISDSGGIYRIPKLR